MKFLPHQNFQTVNEKYKKVFSSFISVTWGKQFLLSSFTEGWQDDSEEILEHNLSVWTIILYSKAH